MPKITKKRQVQDKLFLDKENLNAEDAIELIKSGASAKFDETIDVAINLGIDPRHADQIVRGVCALPHGTGKSIRIAVFAKGDKASEATKAGADIVGAEDLMETVLKGNIEDANSLREYEKDYMYLQCSSETQYDWESAFRILDASSSVNPFFKTKDETIILNNMDIIPGEWIYVDTNGWVLTKEELKL